MPNTFQFQKGLDTSCLKCGKHITEGWMEYNSKGSWVNIICSDCHEVKTVTEIKQRKLVVKQITQGFWSYIWGLICGQTEDIYWVKSSVHMLVTSQIITQSELLKYLDDQTIDIKIIY